MCRLPVLLLALLATTAAAGELPDFASVKVDGVIHTAVGVTRRGTSIDLFVSAEDRRDDHDKTRLVIVGGADGDRGSVDAALEALRWFYTHRDAAKYREQFTLAVIPCASPDGVLLDKGRENGAGGRPGDSAANGKRYLSQTNVESQYIDAWLQQHGALPAWYLCVTGTDDAKASQLNVTDGKVSPALLKALDRLGDPGQLRPLPNRKLLVDRLRQDDKAFVQQLLQNYSHRPKSKLYFDTLPMKAARRLREQGIQIALPEYDWGAELPKSGSELSGMLYMLEDGNVLTAPQIGLLCRSADLAFEQGGTTRKSPPFYSQMSDAVFMNGPLLSGVGKLTEDEKYFGACATQQAVIRGDCERKDGLYRHSPLCEAAWGRGNGFVALGHALMLEDWPAAHPEHAPLLKAYRSHMTALKKHQDYTGMWHQVIDRPESYREFTGTCMIAFAMARGVRAGWLDRSEFQSSIDAAWRAVKVRTSDRGEFVDVCTGTGKQKTLRDYYDREALQGRDGRGASMLLLLASEMLRSEN